MSDDNDDSNLDLLFGLGLGYLWAGRAERHARQEKEQLQLEKEQLKLDKLIAEDRGQTLDEYREWLEQQTPEEPDTELKPFSWQWYLAILLGLAFWALVFTYPVWTICISITFLTVCVVFIIILAPIL